MTKQAVIFFEGLQESLKAWENPEEPKYGDQMLRVGAILKKVSLFAFLLSYKSADLTGPVGGLSWSV